IRRARPKVPFDSSMIGRQTCIPQHDRGDDGEARNHDLARGAVACSEPQQRSEWNTDVKRIALIEAKRTRRIAKNVLEKKEAADRQRADDRHYRGGGDRRVTAKQGHIIVHCARETCRWIWWCRWSGSNR